MGDNEIEDLRKKTLDPSFKGAVVGPLSEVMYENKKNYKNFTYHVLPEVLLSMPVAMYYPKNHFLASTVNSKIRIIQSAGLIDKLMSKYLEMPKQTPSTGPSKLSVKHLAGGLYIYVGGCLIAMICFLLEKFCKIAFK